LFYFYTGRW